MNKKLRQLMILFFAVAFAFSGLQLFRQHQAYRVAQDSQSAALEAVMSQTEVPVESAEIPEDKVPLISRPEERAAPLLDAVPEPIFTGKETDWTLDDATRFLMDMDLEALRQTNPDVLGWIYIPDTVISYPLMKAKDNQEYLYQTWDGKYSKYGSIFLECRNSHDLSDFNTLIYGHNMLTEDMFGTLNAYKAQDYYESHPSVYIRTDEGVRRYDIFSSYEAKVVSNTYRLIFEDDARKEESLGLYTSSSLLESELTPTVEDHILTLSTCTGRGTPDLRFVVQAILVQQTEKAGS